MRTVRLEEAVNEYARHCTARGLAPGTILGQRNTLGLVQKVLGNVWLREISPAHIDSVFNSYAWGPSTRNTKIGLLKAFFKWARARGYTNQDPMFGWRQMRTPEKQRTRIPHAEWPRLFEACIHPQERITIATGLYLFLRASEQQALQLKHIDLGSGLIDVWRSKTKQWDTMPISFELDHYLRAYLTWLAEQSISSPEAYLIGARTRINRNASGQLVAGTGVIDCSRPVSHLHRIVQRVLDRAGYPVSGEGEHTLRRSGARAYFDSLLQNGYDGALRRVQSMLGHSHSIMTEQYLGLDLDRQQRNQDLSGQPMFPTINVRSLNEQRSYPAVRRA